MNKIIIFGKSSNGFLELRYQIDLLESYDNVLIVRLLLSTKLIHIKDFLIKRKLNQYYPKCVVILNL